MRVVSLTLTRKSQYHLLLVCRFLLVRGVGLLGFRVSENFLQARAFGTNPKPSRALRSLAIARMEGFGGLAHASPHIA